MDVEERLRMGHRSEGSGCREGDGHQMHLRASHIELHVHTWEGEGIQGCEHIVDALQAFFPRLFTRAWTFDCHVLQERAAARSVKLFFGYADNTEGRVGGGQPQGVLPAGNNSAGSQRQLA